MRRVLVVVVVLAVALVALVVGEVQRGSLFADRYSSFRGGEDGLKALYLALAELQVPVARLHEPPARVGHRGVLLVALGKSAARDYEAEAAAELLDWVRAGNALVVAHAGPNPFLAPLGKDGTCAWRELGGFWLKEELELGPGTAPVAIERADPVPLTDGVQEAWMLRPGHYTIGVAEHVVLLRGDDGPAAVSLQLGKGTLVLLSDPYPLSNAGLRQPGNLELALNLAALRGEGSVGFEEAAHGYATELSTVGYLRRKGLGPALGQLLLAALAGLVLALPRRPREEREGESEEVGSATYLDAMARVYAEGGYAADAAHDLAAGLRAAAVAAGRLDPRADLAELQRSLARAEPGLAASVAQAIAAGEARPRLSAAALVGYHNHVLALAERLKGGARTRGKGGPGGR
jgi:hypothetical protein